MTAIIERPILFSGPMVRAILEGRKTQTRRIVEPQSMIGDNGLLDSNSITKAMWRKVNKVKPYAFGANFFCPYGQPGDQLWVRETWQGYRQISIESDEWDEMASPKDRHEQPYEPVFKADGKNFPEKWQPSIHMPREYSRIDLRITGIRVERLNDISRSDAISEGITPYKDFRGNTIGWQATTESGWYAEPVNAFDDLWTKINGPASWEENPFVWVVEFERVQKQQVAA